MRFHTFPLQSPFTLPVAYQDATQKPVTENATGLPQFSGKPYAGFPYQAYADLMVEFSVQGIQPDDLVLFTLSHINVSDKALSAYITLLKNGYNLGVQIVPETIEAMKKGAPQAAKIHALEADLAAQYNHAVVLDETTPANGSLEELSELMERKAKPNESVQLKLITKDSDALLEALMQRTIAAGGIPFVLTSNNGSLRTNEHLLPLLLSHAARKEQLAFIPPEERLIQRHQKLFQIRNEIPVADENHYNVLQNATADATEKQRYADNKTYIENLAERRDVFKAYMARMKRVEWEKNGPGDGFFRTMSISPNTGIAERLNLPDNKLAPFLTEVLYLDEPNPTAWYQTLDTSVQHLADQFSKFEKIRVWRDDGKTDLSMSLAGRKMVPSSGTGNAVPAEIFTSPVDDSANGRFYINLPVNIDGYLLEGITFTFKDGEVTEIQVEKGSDEGIAHFKQLVLPGEGNTKAVVGFNRLGEFAVGLNRKITELTNHKPFDYILLSEKQDVHIALGNAYTVAGGTNESPRHEDMMTGSGPGSGFHIEGWLPGKNEPMRIYDEGKFTDAFVNTGLLAAEKKDVTRINNLFDTTA